MKGTPAANVTHLMTRFSLTLIALTSAACAGSPSDPATPDDSHATVSTTADPNAPVTPPDVPEGCDFRVGDECYDNADAACDAAGCPRQSCQILESYPAQIACE
jgi:hypothetical protein